ncbi:MAG: hypothetical protein V1798_01610 [Pseudomonadota bacterium]
MLRLLCAFLFLLIPRAEALEATKTPLPVSGPKAKALIEQVEAVFYQADRSDRYDRTEETLNQLEKVAPDEPYLWWARARLAFFRREALLLSHEQHDLLQKKRLDLAEECHKDADRCLRLAPKNAECHMLKGGCYAMQASTWGVSLKSVQVLIPMDHEWDLAMSLPSDFKHMNSDVTTRQLTEILRAILYRVMPDSWWFRFFAGIRGNKEKAYRWMREAMHGSLLKEPMLLLEEAVASLCYAQDESRPELAIEGVTILKEGLALKPRDASDKFDQSRMKAILAKPQDSCNYRREQTEDLSDAGVASKLHSNP